jgi:hypothetical protein
MKKITTIITLVALFTASYSYGFSPITNSAKSQILADSVDLTEYVGSFKMAEGSPVETIHFTLKEGKLTVQAGEYPEANVITKKKDIFDLEEMGVVFTFIRTENKVNKLKLEVQGMVILGDKIEAEKK